MARCCWRAEHRKMIKHALSEQCLGRYSIQGPAFKDTWKTHSILLKGVKVLWCATYSQEMADIGKKALDRASSRSLQRSAGQNI